MQTHFTYKRKEGIIRWSSECLVIQNTRSLKAELLELKVACNTFGTVVFYFPLATWFYWTTTQVHWYSRTLQELFNIHPVDFYSGSTLGWNMKFSQFPQM